MGFRDRIVRLSQLTADSITGALIRTAATGLRWELLSGGVTDSLFGYTGDPAEGQPGHFKVIRQDGGGVSTGQLELLAPQFSAAVGGAVYLSSSNNGTNYADLASGGTHAAKVRAVTDSTANQARVELTFDVFKANGAQVALEDTGWTAATLGGTWANFGSPWAVASYRRINGVVHLKGLVKGGAMGSAMFVLPAGYRPTDSNMFTNASNAGGTEYASRVDVDASGNVTPQAGNNTAFSLSGIAFPVG